MSWDYGPLAGEIYELDKPIGYSFGDVEYYTQPATYRAVIIPTGSITLLDGRKTTLQALACFHESLVPGGHLIVDVPAPRLVTQPEPMRYWRRDSCLWTLQTLHIEYNRAANQTTYFLRYDKWQDGTLLATELQPFRLQHWSLHEFKEMLGEAGFTGIRVTADWQDNCAPGPGNEDRTFHATRWVTCRPPATACSLVPGYSEPDLPANGVRGSGRPAGAAADRIGTILRRPGPAAGSPGR